MQNPFRTVKSKTPPQDGTTILAGADRSLRLREAGPVIDVGCACSRSCAWGLHPVRRSERRETFSACLYIPRR